MTMKMWMRTRLGLMTRMTLMLALPVLSLGLSQGARAETITRPVTAGVYGSAADSYSLSATSAGTLTVMVTSVPWPVPLSALSFNTTTATDALTPLPSPTAPEAAALSGSEPLVASYQVGPGTYFAHVFATAGPSSLNFGLYSVKMTFTPVPLPAGVGLLMIGILVLLALRRTMKVPRNESVMY